MTNSIQKKIIAFDIDGTLFHTSKKKMNNSFEMVISTNKRYVKVRPHLDSLFEYLETNKEYFELIIYSAATMNYIQKLLELVDTKNLIKEIYAREHCDLLLLNGKVQYNKNYKKINKNLHNLYLVDDSEHHFENYDVIGYKCKKFTGDKTDNEVFNIIDFLNMLKVI
jgi:TFIIF-interacting CTD phosphatase-like protein